MDTYLVTGTYTFTYKTHSFGQYVTIPREQDRYTFLDRMDDLYDDAVIEYKRNPAFTSKGGTLNAHAAITFASPVIYTVDNPEDLPELVTKTLAYWHNAEISSLSIEHELQEHGPTFPPKQLQITSDTIVEVCDFLDENMLQKHIEILW